jgi:long-subunit fatty acid transport protein
MFKKILFGTALIFALSPAFAGSPSYNFIDIGYLEAEFDDDLTGFSVDGDGYGISGSFEVGENWFVGVGYSSIGFDFGVDLDQVSVGGGYHFGMSDRTDFFATLSYLWAEASVSNFDSVDEDGYGVAVGIRSMLTDNFELNGSIGYADLGDGADGTSFNAGALYSFTKTFAIGFDIGIDEDVTLYALGGRFYFGN